MKNGRMQAKDLDDRLVLATIHRLAMAPRSHAHREPPHWVFVSDLSRALDLDDKGRLLLAKCEALIRRRLLDGCACGCRGDFELTQAGLDLLHASKEGGD